MKKILIAVALLPLVVLAQTKSFSAGRAFKVSTVAPIATTKFNLGKGFVIGGDGTARTCPEETGVGTFVRIEESKAQNAFVNIDSKQILVSSADRVFTIACIKVE